MRCELVDRIYQGGLTFTDSPNGIHALAYIAQEQTVDQMNRPASAIQTQRACGHDQVGALQAAVAKRGRFGNAGLQEIPGNSCGMVRGKSKSCPMITVSGAARILGRIGVGSQSFGVRACRNSWSSAAAASGLPKVILLLRSKARTRLQ